MNLYELLHITNQVRQGGVLSPYLFALYLDDLSIELNMEDGCYIIEDGLRMGVIFIY